MQGWWIGLLGVAAILVIAVAFSAKRSAINPRVVATAFALQVAVAALVLYVPPGRAVIAVMASGVEALLGYADAGIDMVFGPLASDEIGSIFAVRVLPVIVFFAALMSVLYHLGIMQRVVMGIGWALQKVIGTKPLESFNAAANIFVGQSEAPIVIKPYLDTLTRPQLFAIMVSGMASVSGTVLAAYAQLGISVDYLLAASFMSAPGGLLMAKIIMPDGAIPDEPITPLGEVKIPKGEHDNIILAAAKGAQDGVMLAVNVAAMLIAFISLIALANGLLGMFGAWARIDDLTIQKILGYVFAPLMALLNIPWSEARDAGAIFGEKVILNEFVAYVTLSGVQESLSAKTTAVLTFALCGFANLSSIAILLGGLGSLIPERMPQIARFGLRAVAAGSLSNLMSAALAGLMIPT